MKTECIDNYGALPVGKYQRLVSIQEEEPVERSLRILEVLTDLTADELLGLPVGEYSDLTRKARFLDVPPRAAKRLGGYVCDGMELVVMSDPRKMTAAQYIDYQTFAAEADTHIVELLSCFLIPKGHKYNERYDIELVHQVIREALPTDAAMGLLAGFLWRLGRSLRASLTYSAWMLRRRAKRLTGEEREQMLTAAATIKEAVRSLRAGDGLPALTLLASVSETAGIQSVE